VLPAIAEVIDIDELLRADIFEDVVEPGFARVEEVAGPISIGIWPMRSHPGQVWMLNSPFTLAVANSNLHDFPISVPRKPQEVSQVPRSKATRRAI
jgi:hypothetical protein